jgi:predicted dehydrogenase
MIASSPSRREFVRTLGRAGVAVGAIAAVETTRGFAANDTLEIACLGTGGRCRALMKSLAEIPNVRIAAVCDVYEDHLEEARRLADPQAIVSRDYRAILDRNDIDAVLIASPDHWHVPMSVDACAAGKDVYVEKPLTHNPAEGPRIIDAQNRHSRVIQVGMQQRSMPHIEHAGELIRQGRIGQVFKVHLSWNRNLGQRMTRTPPSIDPARVLWKEFLGSAPDQPFDPYRFRNWRWFWDFGGGLLADLMVHWIDVAHWLLDLDHPLKATAMGDHFAASGAWETPDSIQCLLSYPNNIQAHFEGTFSNARNGSRIEFMGTDGTLYIDRGRYEIHPERGQGAYEERILGSNPRRGADFYDRPDGELLHLTNWVECIRTRSRPTAPAEAGVAAAAAAHLGNQAYRKGLVAEWPPA